MFWAFITFITFILQFSIVFLVSRPVKMPTTPVLHLQCEVRRLRLRLRHLCLPQILPGLRLKRRHLSPISRSARSTFSAGKPKRRWRRWRQATRVHLEATPATSPGLSHFRFRHFAKTHLFPKTQKHLKTFINIWNIKLRKYIIIYHHISSTELSINHHDKVHSKYSNISPSTVLRPKRIPLKPAVLLMLPSPSEWNHLSTADVSLVVGSQWSLEREDPNVPQIFDTKVRFRVKKIAVESKPAGIMSITE